MTVSLVPFDRLHPGQQFTLSPAATVVLRPKACVQFGLDASCASIIECDSQVAARRLADVLRACNTPTPVESILRSLVSVNIDIHLARAILEDLIGYRVLTPHRPRRVVALVGNSPLARTIVRLLPDTQWQLYTKDAGTNITDFILQWGNHAPLLCVDTLLESPGVARATQHLEAPTLIQAAVVDGHGWVGPVMIDGEGACPLCAELYRIDRDPHWRTLLAQQLTTRAAVSPATLAATAAEVVTILSLLATQASIPPGVKPRTIRPGEQTVIEPYSGQLTHSLVAPHRFCDVCFTAQRN
ncbi:MAG: hypothetical protein SPI77_00140 [Corynebacterium sp.]|nr:hypothetical protein [Corynebacterium sp.]